MGKDRRAEALDVAAALLAKVSQRRSLVDQRMDDLTAGYPSGGQGGSEVYEGEALGYVSSTEANALNPNRDVVGPDKKLRDQLIREVTERVRLLDVIERKYLSNDGDKPPDPPGCQVVGRFKGKDGRPLWAPVDRQTDGTGFLVHGAAEFNAGQSIGVCDWAYKFGRRVGRWPYRAEVEAHLLGRDVRVAPVEQVQVVPQRIKRGWRKVDHAVA